MLMDPKIQGYLYNNLIPGLIITGGNGGGYIKAELYNPVSGNSCPVQNLQQGRYWHTSCSGILCGSGTANSFRTCEKIRGNEASRLLSLELRQVRGNHLCWSLPGDKILLFGGYKSPTTTEIVTGSSSSDSFDLPYKTM